MGFGRIGRAVARRTTGFGLRVLYHGPLQAAVEVERELRAEYRAFEKLLAETDAISVRMPLSPSTRHLLGAGRSSSAA